MAQAEILVTGAGGFIGGHLVAALRRNRLGLLGELRALFTRSADLSLLPG